MLQAHVRDSKAEPDITARAGASQDIAVVPRIAAIDRILAPAYHRALASRAGVHAREISGHSAVW